MTRRVQDMLSLLTAALLSLSVGCNGARTTRSLPELQAPYAERQVWAVAPLRNESGSLQADGAAIADHLARQLENAGRLDVVPVNRVLAAMEALGLAEVASPQQAAELRRVLQVDGLVVGTVSAYEPYDPPKLGLAVELYLDPRGRTSAQGFDLRQLTRAPTDELSVPPTANVRGNEPASVVSGYFDAADPQVRRQLKAYAAPRGIVAAERRDDPEAWRLYRSSMDLYTEFVSYLVSSRLLQAESTRLTQPGPATDPAS